MTQRRGPQSQNPERDYQAGLMRRRTRAARDIGDSYRELPAVADPLRRELCERDLELFLRTYLPAAFCLPFSDDHRAVVHCVESAILDGGLFLNAVYRGFGKTTITRGAVLWSVLYGHKRYVPIIAATAEAADELVRAVQQELEMNPLLLEDFRAACFPFVELEGIAHRAPGQICDGQRTLIGMSKGYLVLPTMADAPESAGVVVKGFGLTGGIRGLQVRGPGGAVLRPDFVVIDDPQTDASARSPSQCAMREKLITGAVLGLAGHSAPISAVMPATVIERDDLVDRLLDQSKHPEWQAVRFPLVKKWADAHETLWLKAYADLRKAYLSPAEGGRTRAIENGNAFYSAHRAEMDAGAVVAWSDCAAKGELSAIQHAYNLLLDRGDAVFRAEYQLDPVPEITSGDDPLKAPQILARVNRLQRGEAAAGAAYVVAYVDLGSLSNAHWAVCWFGDHFTGGVLDYGMKAVRRTGGGVEAAVYGALDEITELLCSRRYPLASGGEQSLDLCVIDSGWQAKTVYDFCRASAHAPLLTPSKGFGGELELRPPRVIARRDKGAGWFCAFTRERKDVKLLRYDVDYWKSFVQERFRTPMGGKGALTLFGTSPNEHRVFVDQCLAERISVKRRRDGETFLKWTLIRGRENHFLDCVVGCHAAAARLGLELALESPVGRGAGVKPPVASRTLQDMLRRK